MQLPPWRQLPQNDTFGGKNLKHKLHITELGNRMNNFTLAK
jgi:hypothetical protein